MSVFADSSALVKLYADEADSALIRNLETIAVSLLARVEVPSALWRKFRLDEISRTDAKDLVGCFEADMFGTSPEPPKFAVVSITSGVLDRAADLLPIHDLRAFDSVQLACAMEVKRVDPGFTEFACFDRRLREAASISGFELLPAD